MIGSLDMAPLTQGNFNFIRDLVRREAAIVLEKGKEYLVETRLSPLAMREGLASVNALIDTLRALGPGHPQLTSSVIDSLTTNETLFFRDLNPFDALREHIIPRFRAANPSAPFTVWSAASSSGQEAYSIAMLLAEHFPGMPARILGTDISSTIVKRAVAGRYDQLEVNRGLP
ncbi:MAG: CheR family methyltransferase, partial [Opitutales bacterium]